MKVSATIFILLLYSCSASNFRKDKDAFEASATIQSFKSVEDLNDSYFVIKENNFFEYYKVLYDSVKNTRYPGKYTKDGDTMILTFYHKKGAVLLGHKALIDKKSNEIVFFDNYPGVRKKLIVN